MKGRIGEIDNMTMSGRCSCGRLLWFDTMETELEYAKNNKEYQRYIELSRPNGLLVCHDCGKLYSEREFRDLKDCRGYGEHSSYSSDLYLAYQQAIARGFENRYRAEANAKLEPTIPLDLIILSICVGGVGLLMKYFTSIVRNPYDTVMLALWDFLFIVCVFGAVIFGFILIGDIITWSESRKNEY